MKLLYIQGCLKKSKLSDFEIRELIMIFELLMTLNGKIMNYKNLDLIHLYNFGTKFVFIRDHTKSYKFSYVTPFVGADYAITHPLKSFLRADDAITRPLEMHL